MIPRCKVGRGITGATRYVLGEGQGAGNDNLAPGDESRVAWIGGTGFGFEITNRADAELARRIMEFDALNQGSRTKPCVNDAVHLSLSWRPGETPTRAQMETAAHAALDAIGMANAKAIFVSHNDEDYAHVHIVASKINPDTNRAYDLKGNYLDLSKWAEGYEREFSGGVICLRREEANRLRDAIEQRDPARVLDLLTEKRATFTAVELDRVLAKQVKGEANRAQFTEQILAHPDIVRLSDQAGGATTRLTTRSVLEAEQHVLLAAEGLRHQLGHSVGKEIRERIAANFEHHKAGLSREQFDAFRHAAGEEGLALIDGQAGTGKSHTMKAIRQGYESLGCTVIGLAPTNAVTADMRRDGFTHAATVHAELTALNNGRKQWDHRTVVMVDEAAMVETKLMAMLTSHAYHAHAKLILVGDDRQLSSIERGGMFGALKDRYGAEALTEVRRQRTHDDKRAAGMLAEGNFHSALEMYDQNGAITWTRSQKQAREALVSQWKRDVAAAPEKSRFVFAYTNDDVARLNAELRDVMRRRGELGADHKLPTADGKQSFAAGDRIQIVATDKGRRLYNGTVGTVQEIQGTKLSVQFDGRQTRPVEFDANEFQKFRHGYAGTIYKGQGRTLDETYLYHSEHWRSAASYVALTRHRDATHLFVARNTAADLTQLARQMARVDDRRAASQFHHTHELGLTQPLTPREVVARFNQTLANRGDEAPRPRSAAGDAQTREQRATSLADSINERQGRQQQSGKGRDGPSHER